jgi:ubiquinone/menaquinone biosynthesis C-methylase UbiE
MTAARAASPSRIKHAEQLQRDYYTRTAHLYDAAHVDANDEHGLALQFIAGFIDTLEITSILDVGCGTGRGISYILRNKPHISVLGIEPVPALIRLAIEANAIPPSCIEEGNGEFLRFADRSIDSAFACGILHHARNPDKIVREMLRVSRKAVFLSDENRFAHGSIFARWAKLALCKAGIFRTAYRLKTLGKGYRSSEGDGVAYSYSVYDSIDEISRWADRVFVIPTDVSSASIRSVQRSSIFHPLLSSFHVLLCATRDPKNGETFA